MGCAASVVDPDHVFGGFTRQKYRAPERHGSEEGGLAVEAVEDAEDTDLQGTAEISYTSDAMTSRPKTSVDYSLTPPMVPPLRIVILIVGSRGDVQPFVAFGKGLQRRGHKVRIATHVCFRDFVNKNGLEYFPLGGDPAELMRYMAEHPDMITLNPRVIETFKIMCAEIYHSTYTACTTALPGVCEPYLPDVIIANPPVQVHVHLAEKLHVPLQIMFTMPWSPTKEYLHPMTPLPGLGNRKSYEIVDSMMWIGLGPTVNAFRKELDLPPIRMGGGIINRALIPQTYCISECLMPKPSDWGPHIDVVGFWPLEEKQDFDPEIRVPRLVQFLESGSPPFYIGFGSIVVDDPKSLSETVVEGVLKSGKRAIIHEGWAKLGRGMQSNPNIFLLKEPVPHDWLFPLCSAVCHHGGAGTVSTGLRLGKPTVVVPFFGDQSFWGECVHRSGAGPAPIHHSKLTAENLSEGIQFCYLSETVAAAEDLGRRMSAEDGVAQGVAAFERKLPMQRNQWACKVYENQRWYPGTGWKATGGHIERGPFTDFSGILSRDKDRFPLPPGWSWDGPWDVVVDKDATDPEGWMYAREWYLNFYPKPRVGRFVRRRKWLRLRSFHPRQDSEVLSVELESLPPPPLKFAYVTVLRATSLKCGSHSGDPYLRMLLRREGKELHPQRTKIMAECLNPEWNQQFFFPYYPNDTFVVECWDWSLSGDRLVGKTEVLFADLLSTLSQHREACLSLADDSGDIFFSLNEPKVPTYFSSPARPRNRSFTPSPRLKSNRPVQDGTTSSSDSEALSNTFVPLRADF